MKFIFVLILFKFSWGQEDEITYYENLITTGREEANNYVLPTDNSQYRPKDDQTVEDFGSWDFIIVGGGCAGAIVANRLTEIRRWKVLLIEAGGQESDFSIIPANHVYLHLSRFNWGYYSTPQNHSCFGMAENRCPVVRGRALGGSTAVNYESYVRGNKDDFDQWAIETGSSVWSYREALPYFIKSENSQINGDPGYHGRGGYWNVKYVRPLSRQTLAFIEGSRVVRNFTSRDYNGRDQFGAFPVQVNNDRQYRMSTNAAFIKPIVNRKNLKIITNSYVTKVLINPSGKRVSGVQFTKDGKLYTAKAHKEVIMAAGATNTPQILMLSGIGPKKHLQEMGIPVVSDLPVGKTLYDHALFYSAYIAINITTPNPSLREQIRQFLNDYGPLTMYSNIQAVGFYQTKYETIPTYPDLETVLTLITGSLETFLVRFLRLRNETYQAIDSSLANVPSVMNAFQFVLRTKSVGSVTLQSNDPYVFPLIDTNFLAEQYDVDILYEGIEVLKRIINSQPLRELNATLILVDYPQCRDYQLGSKDYWVCAFRLMTGSSYHQSGTCRMGRDPRTSVATSRGMIHGFKNLRIVDISTFPSILAGHTAAPTAMIAERMSDFIKLHHGAPIQPITNTIYY